MIDNMPPLIRLRNGEKVQNTFSLQEYANRMSKVRKHMSENNIDAVLFTSYHNINYYSDFLFCSFGRFYGLVVTQDKVVLIAANIDHVLLVSGMDADFNAKRIERYLLLIAASGAKPVLVLTKRGLGWLRVRGRQSGQRRELET